MKLNLSMREKRDKPRGLINQVRSRNKKLDKKEENSRRRMRRKRKSE
jgi:hypothetical protein